MIMLTPLAGILIIALMFTEISAARAIGAAVAILVFAAICVGVTMLPRVANPSNAKEKGSGDGRSGDDVE
jgi:hypothetical protein